MADQSDLNAENALDFFHRRIGRDTAIWCANELLPLGTLLRSAGLDSSTALCSKAQSTIDQVTTDGQIRGLQLNEQYALVVAQLPDCDSGDSYLMSVVLGPVQLARNTIRCAVEAWSLSSGIAQSRAAQAESNKLLVRSFEERTWLRGFARNAIAISRSTSANVLTEGVLDPLGYLLRSAGLFLIVDAEETLQSGLISTRFGRSTLSIDSITTTLASYDVVTNATPLILNNLRIDTDGGRIDSLVAVSIEGPEQSIGVLVAVNRVAQTEDSEQSAYEPEYGSSDVVLMQEAATLFAAQVQNVNLLLQSNQLSVGTLHAMSRAVEARDRYTQGHSERVAQLSLELAQILGLSDSACQEIYLAGILHDVGKIGIPDQVLHKEGALTNEEFAIIRQHPEIGHRIIAQLKQLSFVLPGVLYHHERWDGRGYPHGLVSLSTPVMARVIAVADAFDAMTSSRPYRNAMSTNDAQAIINEGAGAQWDADIVSCFNQWLETRFASDRTGSLETCLFGQGAPVADMVQTAMTLVN